MVTDAVCDDAPDPEVGFGADLLRRIILVLGQKEGPP